MATTYSNRTNSVNEEIAKYDNTTNPHIDQKVKNLKKKLKKKGLDPKGHPQIKGV